MASPLKILWESNAIKLLDTRDRYTRSAILEDFTSAPDRDAVPSLDESDGFMTPVSNRQYSVLWRRKDDRTAVVKAVMPAAVHTAPDDGNQELHRVLWESDAIKLLDARDRFTRSSILDDFANAPERDAVAFDRAGKCFLTPVSNRRYTVVWREADGDRIVRAVVPVINAASGDENELKARVERAIERESRGVTY